MRKERGIVGTFRSNERDRMRLRKREREWE